MSNKTVPSKWVKNRELIVLAIVVAFIVHFAGLPTIFATYFAPIPFGILMVGSGLTAMVYSLKKLD